MELIQQDYLEQQQTEEQAVQVQLCAGRSQLMRLPPLPHWLPPSGHPLPLPLHTHARQVQVTHQLAQWCGHQHEQQEGDWKGVAYTATFDSVIQSNGTAGPNDCKLVD